MRRLSVRLLALVALIAVLGPPAAASAHQKRPLVIGHRGAAGYLPDHTLQGYQLAIDLGADYIEPDLVSTKDGVLVARHEPNIIATTNVLDHPEFKSRRRDATIDGATENGFFASDFTLKELKTLRAKERLPDIRPNNTKYDGRFEIPTFQEVLDLRAALSRKLHRQIGVYPETKHPTYFRSEGLALEPKLVSTLNRNGLNRKGAPVFVQSFEIGNLQALDHVLKVPLVQLLDEADLHPAGDPSQPSYGELATPAGLRRIATYADGVGPWKNYIIPRTADDCTGTPTSFVRDAHRAGLVVHPYTFRRENAFTPCELDSSADPAGIGDLVSEIRQFIRLGVDGFFTDNADYGVRARS
jgi:glycerophosphoryl diester phosphodiesterase